MELPLAGRFKQLKATSKETVGVYRLVQWCFSLETHVEINCVLLDQEFKGS